MDPRFPDRATWEAGLTRLRDEVLAEWGLTLDGPPVPGGHASLVLPVLAPTGPAVLKLGLPHEEAEHEPLALQRLGGSGAVLLLRADPRRFALLLERLPGPDLGEVGDVEACEVVGGLYGTLHVPSPPQLRLLSTYVGAWGERLAALPRSAPVPHRLVEQAVSLGRDLVDGTHDGPQGRLLHTDLHFAHVLADLDGTWRAIDPEPLSGDPHYEPAPMLWNRWDEVVASGDVRDAVRRRFHTLVDAALLDEARARDWVVVRMVTRALRAVEEAAAPGGELDTGWLTRCVTIAKAVQD